MWRASVGMAGSSILTSLSGPRPTVVMRLSRSTVRDWPSGVRRIKLAMVLEAHAQSGSDAIGDQEEGGLGGRQFEPGPLPRLGEGCGSGRGGRGLSHGAGNDLVLVVIERVYHSDHIRPPECAPSAVLQISPGGRFTMAIRGDA